MADWKFWRNEWQDLVCTTDSEMAVETLYDFYKDHGVFTGFNNKDGRFYLAVPRLLAEECEASSNEGILLELETRMIEAQNLELRESLRQLREAAEVMA